jgi:hypothetical protein
MSEAASEPLGEEQLLAGFLDGSLPASQFHHEQHVHVAYLFVRRHGLPAALDAFSSALKAFAIAKGVPTLYHATITWAYLLLINERLAKSPAETWTDFAAAHPDLLTWKPSILDRYYTSATLWSDLARRTFLMPDR